MLIRVMYTDGRFDMVKPQILDNLLETKKVSSFKRTESWAVIGHDTLRGSSAKSYKGQERRAC